MSCDTPAGLGVPVTPDRRSGSFTSQDSSIKQPKTRNAMGGQHIPFLFVPPGTTARARNGQHVPQSMERSDALMSLTLNLLETYQNCNPEFKYNQNKSAPKRVLTKLAEGVYNNGYDNSKHDYICRVRDQLTSPDGRIYSIVERLGHGTFGQVLKVQILQQDRERYNVNPAKAMAEGEQQHQVPLNNSAGTPPFSTAESGGMDQQLHSNNAHNSQQLLKEGGHVALKIIKNKPAYFHQALVEVRILKMLNEKYDEESRIVRMLDFFVYRKHLCIAFEILSVNLYDVLKQNGFRGLSTLLIRNLVEQIVRALQCLRKARIIHCDLKPENVLLSTTRTTNIKLIDFGSACFEGHIVYTYIQSRFYRSPEVLLGLPYSSAIDLWSLGCICAELFIGLPIFPGCSEYDQVKRITEVCGIPPARMMEGGNASKYFVPVPVNPEVDNNQTDNCSSESASGEEEEEDDEDEESTSTLASPTILQAPNNQAQQTNAQVVGQGEQPPATATAGGTTATAAASNGSAANCASDQQQQTTASITTELLQRSSGASMNTKQGRQQLMNGMNLVRNESRNTMAPPPGANSSTTGSTTTSNNNSNLPFPGAQSGLNPNSDLQHRDHPGSNSGSCASTPCSSKLPPPPVYAPPPRATNSLSIKTGNTTPSGSASSTNASAKATPTNSSCSSDVNTGNESCSTTENNSQTLIKGGFPGENVVKAAPNFTSSKNAASKNTPPLNYLQALVGGGGNQPVKAAHRGKASLFQQSMKASSKSTSIAGSASIGGGNVTNVSPKTALVSGAATTATTPAAQQPSVDKSKKNEATTATAVCSPTSSVTTKTNKTDAEKQLVSSSRPDAGAGATGTATSKSSSNDSCSREEDARTEYTLDFESDSLLPSRVPTGDVVVPDSERIVETIVGTGVNLHVSDTVSNSTELPSKKNSIIGSNQLFSLSATEVDPTAQRGPAAAGSKGSSLHNLGDDSVAANSDCAAVAIRSAVSGVLEAVLENRPLRSSGSKSKSSKNASGKPTGADGMSNKPTKGVLTQSCEQLSLHLLLGNGNNERVKKAKKRGKRNLSSPLRTRSAPPRMKTTGKRKRQTRKRATTLGSNVSATTRAAAGPTLSRTTRTSSNTNAIVVNKTATTSTTATAANTIDHAGMPATKLHNKQASAMVTWRLKTKEEYERSTQKKEGPSKKYFDFSSLEEMVQSVRASKTTPEEKKRREQLLDFLKQLFQIDPAKRMTPDEALRHPFLTGQTTPVAATATEGAPCFPTPAPVHKQDFKSDATVDAAQPFLLPPMPDLTEETLRCLDLPPDQPESYRPPVDALPDSYFYGFLHGRYREQRTTMQQVQEGAPGTGAPSSSTSTPASGAGGSSATLQPVNQHYSKSAGAPGQVSAAAMASAQLYSNVASGGAKAAPPPVPPPLPATQQHAQATPTSGQHSLSMSHGGAPVQVGSNVPTFVATNAASASAQGVPHVQVAGTMHPAGPPQFPHQHATPTSSFTSRGAFPSRGFATPLSDATTSAPWAEKSDSSMADPKGVVQQGGLHNKQPVPQATTPQDLQHHSSGGSSSTTASLTNTPTTMHQYHPPQRATAGGQWPVPRAGGPPSRDNSRVAYANPPQQPPPHVAVVGSPAGQPPHQHPGNRGQNNAGLRLVQYNAKPPAYHQKRRAKYARPHSWSYGAPGMQQPHTPGDRSSTGNPGNASGPGYMVSSGGSSNTSGPQQLQPPPQQQYSYHPGVVGGSATSQQQTHVHQHATHLQPPPAQQPPHHVQSRGSSPWHLPSPISPACSVVSESWATSTNNRQIFSPADSWTSDDHDYSRAAHYYSSSPPSSLDSSRNQHHSSSYNAYNAHGGPHGQQQMSAGGGGWNNVGPYATVPQHPQFVGAEVHAQMPLDSEMKRFHPLAAPKQISGQSFRAKTGMSDSGPVMASKYGK
ncbi:unnamed protein product [Amoebophrya sp. A120]|nr:unnamed protein product [Amoebophrya sp. A120]|eukprot:GSA120T00011799001.1